MWDAQLVLLIVFGFVYLLQRLAPFRKIVPRPKIHEDGRKKVELTHAKEIEDMKKGIEDTRKEIEGVKKNEREAIETTKKVGPWESNTGRGACGMIVTVWRAVCRLVPGGERQTQREVSLRFADIGNKCHRGGYRTKERKVGILLLLNFNEASPDNVHCF